MSYDDYFGRPDKDSYTLARAKRDWVPEWVWWIAAHLDGRGAWLCHWLSTAVSEV